MKSFLERVLSRAIRNNENISEKFSEASEHLHRNTDLVLRILRDIKFLLRENEEALQDIEELLRMIQLENRTPITTMPILKSALERAIRANRNAGKELPKVYERVHHRTGGEAVTLLNIRSLSSQSSEALKEFQEHFQSVELKNVIDLTQLSRTPFLSQDDISKAYKMSELYIILHCYENSVRHFIEQVLFNELGEDWWEQAASQSMKNFVEGRKNTEEKTRWLSSRGHISPLYYLEWNDLVKLIRKYESLFLQYIGTMRFVENRFEELEGLRNIVAHNGVLPSDDDFQRVVISFRDWCRQIGSKSVKS